MAGTAFRYLPPPCPVFNSEIGFSCAEQAEGVWTWGSIKGVMTLGDTFKPGSPRWPATPCAAVAQDWQARWSGQRGALARPGHFGAPAEGTLTSAQQQVGGDAVFRRCDEADSQQSAPRPHARFGRGSGGMFLPLEDSQGKAMAPSPRSSELRLRHAPPGAPPGKCRVRPPGWGGLGRGQDVLGGVSRLLKTVCLHGSVCEV